jgi:hypothetical protein
MHIRTLSRMVVVWRVIEPDVRLLYDINDKLDRDVEKSARLFLAPKRKYTPRSLFLSSHSCILAI